MTREEFDDCLLELELRYTDIPRSPEMRAAWFSDFAEQSLTKFSRAVARFLKTETRWPPGFTATMRNHLREVVEPEVKKPEPVEPMTDSARKIIKALDRIIESPDLERLALSRFYRMGWWSAECDRMLFATHGLSTTELLAWADAYEADKRKNRHTSTESLASERKNQTGTNMPVEANTSPRSANAI